MRISNYQEKDKEQVKSLISSVLKEIFHTSASGLEDLDNIKENFKMFLVAKEKNEVIGTVGIKEYEGSARISRMYLRKDYRGKGLGKKLMKKVLDYSEKHYDKVMLTTYTQMGSQTFYERMGFNVSKKEGDRIWMDKP